MLLPKVNLRSNFIHVLVRDQGVFNIRDAAREVKKLLQRKNVYHMTDPQCEQEFWDVYRLQMQWRKFLSTF